MRCASSRASLPWRWRCTLFTLCSRLVRSSSLIQISPTVSASLHVRCFSSVELIRPATCTEFCETTAAVRLRRLLPGFQHYVSVHSYPYLPVPFQKYVRITFIRTNSVACVKETFSVAVRLPFPFIRSYTCRIEFFYRIRLVHGTKTATALQNGSADRLGKRPQKRIRMNGYVMLENRHWKWTKLCRERTRVKCGLRICRSAHQWIRTQMLRETNH